jgi:hypothetical protein
MFKRVIIGGFLGGLTLFCWGAVSHMVFHLGDAGLRSLPSEDTALPALRAVVKEPGLYFFPGIDMKAIAALPKDQANAAEQAWTDKWKAGPRGLLIIHPEPTSAEPITSGTLGRQFGIDLFACLLLAYLMSQLSTSLRYSCRVGVAATVGFISGWVICVPYWNWYGFPGNFTLGSIVDRTIGFTLAGLAMAAIVNPSRRPGAASLPPAVEARAAATTAAA